jgi:hypothetical protein
MAEVTGGNKTRDYLEDLASRIAHKALELQVGYFDDSGVYAKGISVKEVANLNEFGHANAPPRPFFRKFVDTYQKTWTAQLRNYFKAYTYDQESTLRAMGELLVRQLKQTIDDYDDVPLADSTIRKKGHDKQLIDTKLMRNSANFKVV